MNQPDTNQPQIDRSMAHESHDRFLIAALAANDLEGRALQEADALVAACPACADLLGDLRAIATATATLPPVTLPRRLDFRLTEPDARRLGARGWRRALQELAGRRLSFTRPLAVGLTTLGLLGVISASIPGGLGGFGLGSPTSLNIPAGGPAAQDAGGRSAAEAQPSPSTPAGAPAAGSSPRAVDLTSQPPQPAVNGSVPPVYGALGSPGATAKAQGRGTGSGSSSASPPNGTTNVNPTPPNDQPGPPPLLVLSIAALVVGVGLLAGQWAGDRLLAR
jgi:hypothetical protein